MRKLVISEDLNSLELHLLDLVHEQVSQAGSARFLVRVAVEGFFAEHAVWVSGEELERFVADLEALERSRTGQAKLLSMSPDELELRIYICDGAGHVAVDGYLRKYQVGFVEFAIRPDTSLLPQIVGELKALTETSDHCLP